MQDKSRSLAVHSVKALLNVDDDILMVNTGSWYTVAHMSNLINNASKIFVCGVQPQAKHPDLNNLFTKMGCKSKYQYSFVDIVLQDLESWPGAQLVGALS